MVVVSDNSPRELSAEEALSEIAESIQRRKTQPKEGAPLFLLGAGASGSCGIPLGDEGALQNKTYAALKELPNVEVRLVRLADNRDSTRYQAADQSRSFEITDADTFMLRLGMELELSAIERIAAFARIIQGELPGVVSKFENNATIDIDTSSFAGLEIRIRTAEDYARPGENYAGVEVFAAKETFDLSGYSHA